MTDPTAPKIRLQAVGWVPAVKASELKVGDQLRYNFGGVYQITEIKDVSAKFLEIRQVSAETGEEYTRRVKKETLVARVPDKDRVRIGHDAPADTYRAQVKPPTGTPGWITVSYGATVEDAVRGRAVSGYPSYFGSVLLDRHGLGSTFKDRAANVEAMADGKTLTSEDGHAFRILPPEPPAAPQAQGGNPTALEGTALPAGHTLGILAEHADDDNARDAAAALVAAGHTPALLSGDVDEDDADTARGTGFMIHVKPDGRVLVHHLVSGVDSWSSLPDADRRSILRAYRKTLRAAGWKCDSQIFRCVHAWRTCPLPEDVTAGQPRGETPQSNTEAGRTALMRAGHAQLGSLAERWSAAVDRETQAPGEAPGA